MRSSFKATNGSKKDVTVNNGFVNKYTDELVNVYSGVMSEALAKAGKSAKKEFTKRTKDEEKLAKQREKFLGTCKFCKQPLAWVKGSNVLTCVNEKCEGQIIKDKDGNVVEKIPFSRLLDEIGMDIAETLLG